MSRFIRHKHKTFVLQIVIIFVVNYGGMYGNLSGVPIRGFNFVLGLTFVVLRKVHLNQYTVVRQNFLEPFHLVILIFDSLYVVFEFHYFFFHHFYEFLLSCAHVHDLHFLFHFVVHFNLNFLPHHISYRIYFDLG